MPEAVIKGRVVASEADPASGISVQLLSRQITEGIPRWVHANTVLADSNGEFRFAELMPGTYKLGTNELMDNDPAVTVPVGRPMGFRQSIIRASRILVPRAQSILRLDKRCRLICQWHAKPTSQFESHSQTPMPAPA